MKVKGIIFDKDGTLFKFKEFWLPIAEKAVEYVLFKLDAPNYLKSEMLMEIGINEGITGVICNGTYSQIAERFNRVLQKHAIYCDNIMELTLEGFHNSYDYGELIPPCTNLSTLFSKFKEENLKIFLVTSDDEYITDKCLNELGIMEFFDGVFTDDGFHKSKPDPYFINLILNTHNVKQDELVMVGDTMVDMTFAQNGNIKAIGVAENEFDKNILKNNAMFVIDDISQLSTVLNDI